MTGFEKMSEESLSGQTRHVAPVSKSPTELREILKQVPSYRVYGLLLSPEPEATLTKMVTGRWDELHRLSGSEFLLLAFQPPSLSQEFEDAWRKELGANFDSIWRNWQSENIKSHGAYDFDHMFDDRMIRRTEMPCLALFTEPDAKTAVIMRIPDWNADDLWQYLKVTFDEIDDCAAEPDPVARLAKLESTLNSFTAKAKRDLGHLLGKAEAYVLAHPAKTAEVSISVVVALATANILPLGVAGIAFLKDLLPIIKPA